MEEDRNFTIEYVPPGTVRSGINDMTDFCLIYRAHSWKLYFFARGEPAGSDGTIHYIVQLPPGLKDKGIDPALYAIKTDILERVRSHLMCSHATKNSYRQGQISFEPY
jgi:hypothetical protein